MFIHHLYSEMSYTRLLRKSIAIGLYADGIWAFRTTDYIMGQDFSRSITTFGLQFTGLIRYIPINNTRFFIIRLHFTYHFTIEQQTGLRCICVTYHTDFLSFFIVPNIPSIGRQGSSSHLLHPWMHRISTNISHWLVTPQRSTEPTARFGETTEIEQTGIKSTRRPTTRFT